MALADPNAAAPPALSAPWLCAQLPAAQKSVVGGPVGVAALLHPALTLAPIPKPHSSPFATAVCLCGSVSAGEPPHLLSPTPGLSTACLSHHHEGTHPIPQPGGHPAWWLGSSGRPQCIPYPLGSGLSSECPGTAGQGAPRSRALCHHKPSVQPLRTPKNPDSQQKQGNAKA